MTRRLRRKQLATGTRPDRYPRRPSTRRTRRGRNKACAFRPRQSRVGKRAKLSFRLNVKRSRRKTGGSSIMKSMDARTKDPLRNLNHIEWDVSQLPERALWKGVPVAKKRSLLEKMVRKGDVRLLLPVVKDPSDTHDGNELVTYAVPVKGKEALAHEIRFGDLLHKIYGFYMATKVSAEDLQFASLGVTSLSGQETPEDLRFENFVHGQTRFNGLEDQGDGTLLLSLGDST